MIVRQTYVRCRECGQQHTTKEIELLDVVEDIEGHDVATFNCPVPKTALPA